MLRLWYGQNFEALTALSCGRFIDVVSSLPTSKWEIGKNLEIKKIVINVFPRAEIRINMLLERGLFAEGAEKFQWLCSKSIWAESDPFQATTASAKSIQWNRPTWRLTSSPSSPPRRQSVSTSLLCDSWNPLPASFVQFSGITPSSSFSSSFLTRRFPITWARSIHLTHPTTSRSRIGFLCIMYFYGFNVLLDFTRTINVFQLGSWFSWIILTDTIIKVNWCQNLTLLWTQRQIVERAGKGAFPKGEI